MSDLEFFGTDGARFNFDNQGLERYLSFISSLSSGLKEISNKDKIRVLVGRDTRQSYEQMQEALRLGKVQGVEFFDGGILSTGAVGLGAKSSDFDYAIQISASHNPHNFNGVKIMDSNGDKLSFDLESKLEQNFLSSPKSDLEDEILFEGNYDASKDYLNVMQERFRGLQYNGKIVFDLANGAGSILTPEVLDKLGLDYDVYCNDTKSGDINLNCGSENPSNLEEIIRGSCDYSVGFAFDGDADRLVVIDENGSKVSGDKVLGFLGMYFRDIGKLKNDTLVYTENTNMALDSYLQDKGLNIERVLTGDKNVADLLEKDSLSFGGENSGHLVFQDFLSHPDSLYSALNVIEALNFYRIKPSQILDDYVPYNEFKINVSRNNGIHFRDIPKFEEVSRRVESQLNGQGRLLVRESGTEPLVRITCESGYEVPQIEKISKPLVDLLSNNL